MSYLFQTKMVRQMVVKPDVEKHVYLKSGNRVLRRSFLITKEHIGLRGPSISIGINDINNVFVVDESINGDLTDYILSPVMHTASWYEYGGYKKYNKDL